MSMSSKQLNAIYCGMVFFLRKLLAGLIEKHLDFEATKPVLKVSEKARLARKLKFHLWQF